jgi:hypothetical protein
MARRAPGAEPPPEAEETGFAGFPQGDEMKQAALGNVTAPVMGLGCMG